MPELVTTLAATEADRLLQAEALVRAYCGWHIAPERADESATVRGNGGNTLLLPSLHVTAVASVTDDGTLLTADDDYIWSQAGIVATSGSFSDGDVVIVFTHGYETPPAEVTAVVQAIAQRAIANTGSLKSKTIGPFSESYASPATLSLLDDEKAILLRYRIPALG